jgi:biopolymer transport protein ExbB
MSYLADIPGTLMEQYRAGGSVMHMILLCSLASIAAILYKAIVFHRNRSDVARLIAGVRQHVAQGRIDQATRFCEQHRGPVAVTLKVGLLNHALPRDELERHMDSAEINELAYLEKYLNLLATITNIAPMIGFFGTVVGMIMSFKVLAETGMDQPELVAEGISVALVTTAFGLLVAFFTQPFLNYFVGRIRSFENHIEVGRIALIDALNTWRRAQAAEKENVTA